MRKQQKTENQQKNYREKTNNNYVFTKENHTNKPLIKLNEYVNKVKHATILIFLLIIRCITEILLKLGGKKSFET